MDEKLKKISSFIHEHHVMSLATATVDELSVCSLFYAFNEEKLSFVVASSDATRHVEHILQNSHVAGNILLETRTVGKIQGVQFRGDFMPLEDKELLRDYFRAFPYALALTPKLWQIKVNWFKMTDNRLGFGEKIIWSSLV